VLLSFISGVITSCVLNIKTYPPHPPPPPFCFKMYMSHSSLLIFSKKVHLVVLKRKSLVLIRKTLVVEQTSVLFDKSDVQLLSSGKHSLVILTASGSGDVLDTRASSAEHVVDEGEEGVR
jgi:hypothetical protein